ncbi:DNA cytosine methyltransferase [Rhodococcus erythropolis]|uniref:DNA cytosine methyltransferase n=1 Tax=Rhodococcus erythropolis TaxID=1833 RepID=UPI003670233A
MRIGSLFSGYGGLDLAALQLFPQSSVAWHCEWDDAPAKILDHHWPSVPNLRDVTEVDWATIEPVDILTGGYPCQPFSAAGQRKGTDDERHLWPYVRDAIRLLRPRFTLLENVAGHRSLGFDRVLGDLAEDGMHVRWTSLRASDIGAPHHRERLFILVADPSEQPGRFGDGVDVRLGRSSGLQPSTAGRGCFADASSSRPESIDGFTRGSSACGSRDGESCGGDRGASPDADSQRHEGRGAAPGADSGRTVATGRRRTPSRGGSEIPADPEGEFPRGLRGGSESKVAGSDRGIALLPGINWGDYGPAVRRWERLTRPAPASTELNSNNKPRLNAAFAEWMMGLPSGHVTQVPGISRAHQLKAIGNGVCPQQAVAAYSSLLELGVAA